MMIGLISLFNGISILVGYLMPKPSDTIQPIPGGGVPRGVMVKAVDCGIRSKRVRTPVVLLRSLSANTLGKGINLLIIAAMG